MRDKDHLVTAVLDGYVDPAALQECKEIYEDKILRVYVESSLLATEDFDEIAGALEIDKHILMLYHDLYYDVHSLSRIQKVRLLSKIEDKDELGLKQWSMTNGLDFIKWRLGIITQAPMVESITKLQADAYFKSKEAFFNGSTSEASKAALQWSKQAVSLAKLLSEIDGDNADEVADSLHLELERITENNVNIPGMDSLI